MTFKFNPISTVETLPRKTIIMWYGTVATIPTGWLFCNGSNGTPDLRNQMIAGADSDNGAQPTTNMAALFGDIDAISGGNIEHTHIVDGVTDPASGGLNVTPSGATAVTALNHTHNFNLDTYPNYLAPVPYYALLFIMKS